MKSWEDVNNGTERKSYKGLKYIYIFFNPYIYICQTIKIFKRFILLPFYKFYENEKKNANLIIDVNVYAIKSGLSSE